MYENCTESAFLQGVSQNFDYLAVYSLTHLIYAVNCHVLHFCYYFKRYALTSQLEYFFFNTNKITILTEII